MYLEESSFGLPQTVMADLLRQWRPVLTSETVLLEQALGRVCARDVHSLNFLPVCRAAAGDGIAVRGRDFENGLPNPAGWVKGRDYAAADTGDDFDDAFDTVIPVEALCFNSNGSFGFKPSLKVKPGQRVIPRGDSLKQGELIVDKGRKITPMHLLTLAMGGHTQVEVYRKPLAAYIPTGSELIETGQKPARGQIIQSGGVMYQAQLALWGAEMLQYSIIKDDRDAIAKALELALAETDIVLLSGGTCKGSEDFTARVVAERASWFQHGVRAAPGRPAGFGIINNKPVVSLPGPPVGAFTILEWGVRPLLYAAAGAILPQPALITGILTEDVVKPPFPYQFTLRVQIIPGTNGYRIRPLLKARGAESSLLCNGLLTAPPDVLGYQAGDTVTARLLYDLYDG